MSTSVFRPLKARKAKFGFEAHIGSLNFILIADAVKRAKELDHDLIFEVDLSYGKGTVKVYTNSEQAADVLGYARYPA
ncbi:hypothetical protein [Burkholderia ubonensis]|uniref:hypothetical protein n=1 Tax=Burkholderia ubonensis TaxID=101571 RepID=UPI000756E84D|nr:hypothetical protein [Burkholderia ubonensis]KVP17397.1 hypothetical protein WJ84_03970 [Burkholderia ubonensis]